MLRQGSIVSKQGCILVDWNGQRGQREIDEEGDFFFFLRFHLSKFFKIISYGIKHCTSLTSNYIIILLSVNIFI